MAALIVAAGLGTSAACADGVASTPTTSAPARSVHHGSVSTGAATTAQHRWDHVVIVIEENRDAAHILGQKAAPYINRLAAGGLSLADMHGERHPSEPNYLALLTGSTQGLTDDSCPHTYRSDNLVAQLLRNHLSFAGYSENLPTTGYAGCNAYPYARKHSPWTDFATAPSSVNRPFTAFPTDFTRLPTVSVVIPNLRNDMHDGSITQGDSWLRSHLAGYAQWARGHRSLLLLTWDEDEGSSANHIATVAVGAGIGTSVWRPRADHYSLLASIEEALGLRKLGAAATASAVTPLA